jgi:hypothetical protein
MEINIQFCMRTLRLKVTREGHAWLNSAAIEVNQVWNYANATSYKADRPFAGAGSQIRAGCRLGHAQDAIAVQGPAGRQERYDRQRERLNANMQRLQGPYGPYRFGHARCKDLGVQCVWSHARSGRQFGPK